MKIVILLAGQGKRFKELTKKNHKSLIYIYENMNILKYLNICLKGLKPDELIFILGHNKDILKKKIITYFKNQHIKKRFIEVDNYKLTSNLYSIFQARNYLKKDDFFIINGDTIFPTSFIQNIMKKKKTTLSVQYSLNKIDAPKVYENKEKKLKVFHYGKKDINSSDVFKGYLTGLIFIKKSFSDKYFKIAKELLNKNSKSPYYGPFNTQKTDQVNIFNQSGLWTDFDEIKERKRVKLILKTILKLKKMNYIF